MFWPDVIDLKLFYAQPLGQLARREIAAAMAVLWEKTPDENILGIGYAQEFLEPYCQDANRVIALMPAAQGALHWPTGRGNLSFLADEAEIPLPDESMHKVLLVHAMENSEQLRHMMREIWRVLTPGGCVLVIVPNRNGAWARVPRSPFAHGSPYSASQLRTVMRDHSFTPQDCRPALFTPPSNREFLLRAAPLFETIGRRFFPMFGGLLLMEGEKQIYATSRQAATQRKRRPTYAPASQPVMTCDSKGR